MESKKKTLVFWGESKTFSGDNSNLSTFPDGHTACCAVQSFAEVWQGIEVHRPELLLPQVEVKFFLFNFYVYRIRFEFEKNRLLTDPSEISLQLKKGEELLRRRALV